uniref:Catenin delta 1 n=1 Tax=Latimeria chalumnae TaxID=7897 RepID=H3AB31_LATCH
MDDSDVESTASILASVKEQEAQFEILTRALEEERRFVSAQLERARNPPDGPGLSPAVTNGTLTRRKQGGGFFFFFFFLALFPGGFFLSPPPPHQKDRRKPVQYSTLPRMQEPHYFEETYTVEEDPDAPASVVSVETSEDGTTRRTETTVKKVIKTVTTRTVQPGPMGMDGVPLEGGPMGQGPYIQTLDRKLRGGNDGYIIQPGTATLPRNYHYSEGYGRPYDDGGGYIPPPGVENYGSLSRVARMDDRYRPAMSDGYRTLDGYRAPSRQDMYGPQPQVRVGSHGDLTRLQPERYYAEPYGLEDDQRSMGYDDIDYGIAIPDYSMGRRAATPSDLRRRLRSYEDSLAGDLPSEHGFGGWAPLAQHERGSMASLDSLRKGPPINWRQPELPEVLAMLNFRLDTVKSNAAAYLQHLCFRNDKVKSDVRRLKGIPMLVSLLDHPKKEVHHSACGALKNISYGKDPDNKVAIKNCDGVPALVRLLRKARDMDLTEVITGTLWNLSSHDSIKMEIVDHALHALADEVIVPHSGWEKEPNEDSKPRHVEWESVLTNTAGCLRNVSSERSEARRKLRECDGLVDALMHIIQSEIGQKDVDSKLVENCVCLLRNLSYQVHREIPNAERYLETPANPAASTALSQQKASCFGTKKSKDEWFARGKKKKCAQVFVLLICWNFQILPFSGYELLFQPEVVRIYISLLKESKTPAIQEAASGAIQNLCAGRWTYGRYLRWSVRQEKGLSVIADRLTSENDRVVRAASGALRNLAADTQNKQLIGKHAMSVLVSNLPGGQQSPAKKLSEETVVSILNTINEVVADNVEAAKHLRETQGIEKLVLINKSGNRTEREVRAAGVVLQTVWSYKELRRVLEKEGWKKSDFQVNLTPATRNASGHGYDDATLPLIDKSQTRGKNSREEIAMNDLGPLRFKSQQSTYTTLDRKDENRTMDQSLSLGNNPSSRGCPLLSKL